MGERTAIEWCDHTFNPVWGCMKVSPACDHCYAETWDKRMGGDHWGPHAPLREFGDKHWAEPLKWHRGAVREGVRRKVFCASMANVFDKRWPTGVRPRLWDLIRRTPNLDWLLLTKRPENVARDLPPDWKGGWPNVMLGVTVESARYLRRVSELLGVAGGKTRCFISYEPALGPLGRITDVWRPGDTPQLAWLLCGGESGVGARPMHPDWARDARDQCAALGIAFHFKQWGDWAPVYAPSRPGDSPYLICIRPDGAPQMSRVGKKVAGRLLDGREHNGFPAGR
jgi:protein gp37